jgi:hypothetical protein
MVRVLEELAGDWRRLDERIEGLSNEIEAIARQNSSLGNAEHPLIKRSGLVFAAGRHCKLHVIQSTNFHDRPIKLDGLGA